VGIGSDVFSRGRFHTSVIGTLGSAFNHDYVVGGLGLGVMLFDGFELGLDGEAWFGAKPKIYKVSPGVRYVFPIAGPLKPYVGVFYKRTTFEGSIKDLDSVGGRAGVYSRVAEHAYAGIGVVHEEYKNCNESIYTHCSSTQPEFNISLWF
jgi:hypothetical protein